MNRSWLTQNNDELESVLISQGGCPRHLGWPLFSQLIDWGQATYLIAERLHSTHLAEAQAYLDMVEAMPHSKRPLNQVLGVALDKAIVTSAHPDHWQTTREQMRAQHLSFEYARALRDHLASKRGAPDLLGTEGVEEGDSLWLLITATSLRLATVPPEFEVGWSNEVHETSRMRSYPVPYTGLRTTRTHRPPDTMLVDGIYMIPPEQSEWVRLNLAAGAASLGDLCIPVLTPTASVA